MGTNSTAVAGPVERGVGPQRTEWTEVRLALRQEYGHPYTYNGVPCMDFSKHVYVGRAGALLLKAEKQAAALLALANAADDVGVRHFDSDTLPPDVEALQFATAAARLALGPNVRAKPHSAAPLE